MHDMTVGSPVKLILYFMVPVFLGNVFQQFYNVADSSPVSSWACAPWQPSEVRAR